jgi:predicted DNA-binding protein YlxM (UPF0122 family)
MLRDLSTKELAEFHEASKAAINDLINSPVESFSAKMAALEQALRKGTIKFGEFSQSVKMVSQQQQQAWSDMGNAVTGFLQAAFPKSKTAAIAIALINTAQAVTKTLAEYGATPWGISMAALAAATGAAQIMQIRSTTSSGGGSVSAPTVSTPSAPDAATGPSQTLTLVGIDPSKWYSGDNVRDLARDLVEYQRNGGKVVFG